MPKVDFLYFDAGGGHRAAATALKAVVEQQDRDWQIRMVHVQETMGEVDLIRKYLHLDTQDAYNLLLKKGWTLGSRQMLAGLHFLIRLTRPHQIRVMANFWRRDPPDLVVSLIPNLNRGVFEGLRASGSKAPYVTILTDIADFPGMWIERQPQYFICGSARAVEQAYALGHPPERVFRVSGMILRPHFYNVAPVDRAAERKRLGLDPDRPTGLVLFGGHGSNTMIDIARRLQDSSLPLQLILMCGHNEPLAAKIRALPSRIPMHIQGFTTEVPYFMQLSDFFIGKPGPGSISEALAMKLPVIVERNAFTLMQERYNADWVLEHGVGTVLPNFREIAGAVTKLLEPGQLEQYRARAAEMNNRAVFEIPDLLQRILNENQVR